MTINLGMLGDVAMDEDFVPMPTREGFDVLTSGYTESGIRVHGVIDTREFVNYPCVWNNAILYKVEE